MYRYTEAPAVRNNILVALVDLCVRYTALVDPYVLRLAVCFRDVGLSLTPGCHSIGYMDHTGCHELVF